MVAGAYKADLLADFRGSVDKAIKDGITLEEFRQDFDGIVERHGWSYHGSRNWRSELIYSTNIRTAYAAGRWAQLTAPDIQEAFGYLEYRHGDSRHPRLHHLSWNGLILSVDDPWWKTHYPPCGWGCKCKALAATKKEWARADDKGKGEAPLSPIDPKTGEPVGIDKGWGYNVGMAAGEKYKILQNAVSRLPEDIGNALIEEIGSRDKEAARIARNKARRAARAKSAASASVDDVSGWKKVEDQKGSNPGGLYEAPDGERYYVKFYADDNQARTEFAANGIYRMMGVEMPELSLRDWNGKTALASKWRTDLKLMKAADMVAQPEEMARIFQASVLTGNWDVVGLNYDNVMVAKNKRLVMIDAGGSFKFRARGGAKAYEAVPDEAKTLRDSTKNREAASVFNAIFKENVWLEREGAESLLKLKMADVQGVFKEAGFAQGEVKELTETLWKRRESLIDRYDLENKLVPKGFGTFLQDFKKWGTTAWTPKNENGLVFGSLDKDFENGMPTLMGKFEEYIRKHIHPYARGVARGLFSEWSGSSSSTGGATIKAWAEDRFGVETRFHYGERGREKIRDLLDSHRAQSLGKAKLDQKTVFRILDAEYELHQYYLRRLHGYDGIPCIRYVSESEFKDCYQKGKWNGNSVQSTTVRRSGFSNHKAVKITIRVEDTLKTFFQGPRYMHYGSREAEYVALGRMRDAEVIK